MLQHYFGARRIEKGGAEAPPSFRAQLNARYSRILALGVRGHRIWSAAVLWNLVRRGCEPTRPASGLRIAAARCAGHAGSPTAVAGSRSLSGRRGTGVVVAAWHLALRGSDSA